MEQIITMINDNLPSPYREIVLSVITGGGAWFTKHVLARNEKQKAIDDTQDKAIKEARCKQLEYEKDIREVKAITESLVEAVAVLQPLVESIAKSMDRYEEDKAKALQLKRLERTITSIGDKWITQDNLSSSDYAMIVAGCQKAGLLFTSVLDDGLDKFDPKVFRMKAITLLKSIKQGVAFNVPEEMIHSIKANAMIELQELTNKIEGLGEQSTYDDYEAVVKDFIYKFLTAFTKTRAEYESK